MIGFVQNRTKPIIQMRLIFTQPVGTCRRNWLYDAIKRIDWMSELFSHKIK